MVTIQEELETIEKRGESDGKNAHDMVKSGVCSRQKAWDSMIRVFENHYGYESVQYSYWFKGFKRGFTAEN